MVVVAVVVAMPLLVLLLVFVLASATVVGLYGADNEGADDEDGSYC